MIAAWKYPLGVEEAQELMLPRGARPLAVHLLERKIYLWVLVDPAAELELRRVLVWGNSDPHYGDADEATACYVGTVVSGGLVWHVFLDRAPE